MKTALRVLSYAVSGIRGIDLPEARLCPLPPPGPQPRSARLPGLAVALSRRALAGAASPSSTAVLFGTALGCVTETEAFVENMHRKKEALPLPRAFSASVHNAVASRVAIEIKAQGECQTFVHGEVSFVQALFAAALRRLRGAAGTALVGGVDESTPYVVRARAACGCEPRSPGDEGGAVFLCGEPGPEERVLAIVHRVSFGPLHDPGEWIARSLDGEVVGGVLVSSSSGGVPRQVLAALKAPAVDCRRSTGDHPSSVSSAMAIAVAILGGELDAASVFLPASPCSLAVFTLSRLGDAGLILLERAS